VSRQLSIFIDESGDFGDYLPHSPHYIVAMLFHEQQVDIRSAVQQLNKKVCELGYQTHALHTGPLIRREKDYLNLSIDERKSLLTTLVQFCRHVDVRYTVLHVDKKDCNDIIELTAKLSKLIRDFVDRHLAYFQSFYEIIVYYDNGQIELTRILTSTLSVLLTNVSFRKVKPSEYKLFQLADMFCSLELTAIKFNLKTVTHSETEFFHSHKDFKKNYLRKIRSKLLR
jgi:hypothetical protein